MAARILLATLGSLGDIHPYLAIARALQARGHRAEIAAGELYRAKIEAEGIAFHPVRPHFSPEDRELAAYVMDARRGPERVLRDLVLPAVRDSFEDLLAAARGADLLVGHPLAFAVPLVAELLGLRWASSVLSPLSFFSVHDAPVLTPFPALAPLRRLGPRVNRWVVELGRRSTLPWTEPVQRLRRELGLPPGGHPVFEGQHSPHLVLALFSAALAGPQADWPPNTVQTGFAFYDRHEGLAELQPELESFLAEAERQGEPPIVFTLGSSAVHTPGNFFSEGAAAAGRLGRRAVLVGGQAPAGERRAELLAVPYAPYSRLFPRAAALVHQCGIGTVGQALAAGRPMLAVPFSHDQPDNAAHLVRAGVARHLPRRRFTAARAAGALARLLSEPRYAERAAALGVRVRAEDGPNAACAALERLAAS